MNIAAAPGHDINMHSTVADVVSQLQQLLQTCAKVGMTPLSPAPLSNMERTEKTGRKLGEMDSKKERRKKKEKLGDILKKTLILYPF